MRYTTFNGEVAGFEPRRLVERQVVAQRIERLFATAPNHPSRTASKQKWLSSNGKTSVLHTENAGSTPASYTKQTQAPDGSKSMVHRLVDQRHNTIRLGLSNRSSDLKHQQTSGRDKAAARLVYRQEASGSTATRPDQNREMT